MGLNQLRDVLGAGVQRHEDQRARDRSRRVRLQHRGGRDERAHARPGGPARRRAGDVDAGRQERVRPLVGSIAVPNNFGLGVDIRIE